MTAADTELVPGANHPPPLGCATVLVVGLLALGALAMVLAAGWVR